MQREFEMVVQTSATTQSLRYLLKSGDMTCITKGEITKRLEAKSSFTGIKLSSCYDKW